MNRNRPYLNRFVKRKQQEIEDSYHSANLREIKPITSKLMDHAETIVINRSKQEMIREVRQIEIERENKMLLQKISSVMSKKGAYSVSKTKNIRTKVNKSLNQIYRKRQLEEIELENKRFVLRLQQKKPTLNVDKLNRDWLDNKNVIRRMANHEFNLTSIKSASRVRSITLDKFYKSKYDRAKISKIKVINGLKMLIKVEFTDEVLKIVGDAQNKKDLKVIEIPRDEAIIFIEKGCNGKLENIIDKLMYDTESESLYLVSDHLEEGDFSEFNPEIDNIIAKKSEKKKQKKEKESRFDVAHPKSSISHHQNDFRGGNDTIQQLKSQTIDITEPRKEEAIQEREVNQKATEHLLSNNELAAPQSPQQEQCQKSENVHNKIDGAPQVQNVQSPQVVESKEALIEAQPDQYEEQKFQESHNTLKESKKKSQPKADVLQAEVVEADVPQEPALEIIVAPQEQDNYNQQFEASGAVQRKNEQDKLPEANNQSN